MKYSALIKSKRFWKETMIYQQYVVQMCKY